MSEENATSNPGVERAGFCQDCGRPLTRETVRAVGNGVFCEPCLARRVGATMPGAAAQPGAGGQEASRARAQGGSDWGPAWSPTAGGGAGPQGHAQPGYAKPGYVPSGYVPPPGVHLPNPTLAGVLGVIPGVGAMYNGQLVKGLLHLAIFAVLVTLDNNVSGVFGLFTAAWVIYQIFDAYHTARARRDGQPLPDPLGLGDLANRIGLKPTWTTQTPYATTPASPPPPGAGAAPPAATAGAAAAAGAEAGWAASGAATPGAGAPAAGPTPVAPGYAASYPTPPANWAGYVHPAAFAVSSPPPPAGYAVPAPAAAVLPTPQETAAAMAAQIHAQAMRDMGMAATLPVSGVYAGADAVAAVAPASARRFPMGALWLIAAGVLVLAGNLSSEWQLSGLWVLAGLFAALAVWTLVRRLEWAGGLDAVSHGDWPRLACMLRAPILLLTLSVLFVLQAAHVATFGQTWPVLLVALGVTVLLERTFGPQAAASLPPFSPIPAYPAAPAVAAATAPVVAERTSTDVRP